MTAPGAPSEQAPRADLAACPVGTVPILWEYRDPDDPTPPRTPARILREIAAAGFEGTQLGREFPEGPALRDALARRGLRLAEVYAALPATSAGPVGGALEIGRQRLRLLEEGDGDVLCVALDGCDERDRVAGRVGARRTPRLSDAGWLELARVLETLAADAGASGRRLAFHPHAGTYVEAPEETARLVATTGERVGICLDVGHWIVGGGDPVEAIRTLGQRIVHVHLKDVDAGVLGCLRSGELDGLEAAVRQRIFTELGHGVLDLDRCLSALEGIGYPGWLMVEQDSSWLDPLDAAVAGRRAVRNAIDTLVNGRHTGAISAEPRRTPGERAGA